MGYTHTVQKWNGKIFVQLRARQRPIIRWALICRATTT